jgi:N6-adenosine-specific RNA methylase IME4
VKYRTIVADPPWPYDEKNAHWVERDDGALLPYQSMSVNDIAALPVKGWSDNRNEDAHLYLWTTSRYLRDAFDIVKEWGFHYAATLVWCKPSRGFSVGGLFQNNVEFVLFARRPRVVSRPEVLKLTAALGDLADAAGISRRDLDEHMGTNDMGGWWLSRREYRCACPTDEQWRRIRDFIPNAHALDGLVADINAKKGTNVEHTPQGSTTRWFEWPRGEHSAKPDAFLDLVEQVSPGPYLEMFARRARFGWGYWGDESLGTAERAA